MTAAQPQSQTPIVDGIMLDQKTGRTIIVHGETFEKLEIVARKLERAARELVDALERYGKHEEGCPVIVTESLRTCGLTRARAAIKLAEGQNG